MTKDTAQPAEKPVPAERMDFAPVRRVMTKDTAQPAGKPVPVEKVDFAPARRVMAKDTAQPAGKPGPVEKVDFAPAKRVITKDTAQPAGKPGPVEKVDFAPAKHVITKDTAQPAGKPGPVEKVDFAPAKHVITKDTAQRAEKPGPVEKPSAIIKVPSTSGGWKPEPVREVSPEVTRFLSVGKQEAAPAQDVPADMEVTDEVIQPQAAGVSQSAPPQTKQTYEDHPDKVKIADIQPQAAGVTQSAAPQTKQAYEDYPDKPFSVDSRITTMDVSEPDSVTVEPSTPSPAYGSVTRGSIHTQSLKTPEIAETIMQTSVSDLEAAAPVSAEPTSTEDAESASSGGSVEYSRTQMTETEEVIETEVEETVTMMIVGVVRNPGDDEEIVISMQEAVEAGILDLSQGLYYNRGTRQHISMVEAMNSGLIKMGQAKVSKSEEKVKSMGIVTIRTTRETMPYTVKAATNTLTGELLNVEQAADLNILDPVGGTYTDLLHKSKMLIGDAVDQKLVEIEYDMKASGTVQEEVLKTYSVHAVVDQKQRKKLAFHEAVKEGIIDKASGEYVHNVTGEKFSAELAINKGYIKATLTDNPKQVSLDDIGNKTAQRGAAAIRSKLLNPLKALRGLKK